MKKKTKLSVPEKVLYSIRNYYLIQTLMCEIPLNGRKSQRKKPDDVLHQAQLHFKAIPHLKTQKKIYPTQ